MTWLPSSWTTTTVDNTTDVTTGTYTTGFGMALGQSCFPSTFQQIQYPIAASADDLARLERKFDALLEVLGKKEAVEVLLRLRGEEAQP